MKLLLIVVGILLVADCGHSSVKKNRRAIDDFGGSLREFAGSMYHTINKGVKYSENIFFSPLSISETLGMVMAGSAGDTFRELEHALLINKNRNYTKYNRSNLFKKIYNKVFNTSRGNPASKALMASRMFVQQRYPVKESYKSDLQTFFDAEAISTNFSDATGAAEMINEWVAEKTEDLIKDLMKPENIDPLTRIVLVNALFFKSAWKNEMLTKGFEQQLFRTAAGEQKRVDFIGQNETIQYDINSQFDLTQVAIPYANDEARLIIIMPEDDNAMRRFVSADRPAIIMSHLKSLPKSINGWRSNTVEFSMPKFALDATLDMTQILEEMGVTHLFDPTRADLSGISSEQLYVGVFKHKAKIIVDNEGTVAAGATNVGVLGRSSTPHQRRIAINRPFLFAIYRHDHLLFFGRVSDPDPTSK